MTTWNPCRNPGHTLHAGKQEARTTSHGRTGNQAQEDSRYRQGCEGYCQEVGQDTDRGNAAKRIGGNGCRSDGSANTGRQ